MFASSGGFFRGLIFVIGIMTLYNIVSGFEAFSFLFGFVVVALTIFPLHGIEAALCALLGAVLFFIIKGVKDHAFINPTNPALFCFALLAYGVSTLFFAREIGSIWCAVVLTILIMGFVRIAVPYPSRERLLVGILVSVISLEILFVLAFLPIGFWNAGLIMLMCMLAVLDIAIHLLRDGNIVPYRILIAGSFCVFASSLILLLSRWFPF